MASNQLTGGICGLTPRSRISLTLISEVRITSPDLGRRVDDDEAQGGSQRGDRLDGIGAVAEPEDLEIQFFSTIVHLARLHPAELQQRIDHSSYRILPAATRRHGRNAARGRRVTRRLGKEAAAEIRRR